MTPGELFAVIVLVLVAALFYLWYTYFRTTSTSTTTGTSSANPTTTGTSSANPTTTGTSSATPTTTSTSSATPTTTSTNAATPTTTVANEFGVTTTATPSVWLQLFTGYDCSGNDLGSTAFQGTAQSLTGAKGLVRNQYNTWYAKSSSSNGFYTDGSTQNSWQYYSSYAIPAAANLFVGWVTATYYITSSSGLALNSTPATAYSISVSPTASGFAAALRAVGTGAFVFNTATNRVCFFNNI